MRGILPRTLLCALVWSCAAGADRAGEWSLPADAAAPAADGFAFDWADIHFGGVIRLQEAHAAYPAVTGAGYALAVIDCGVTMTHPALAGRYVGGHDYGSGDSLPLDTHGHGTHVTGIAVSADANHVGVAPQAGYAALKVSPDASSSVSLSAVKQSLQWVLDHRVEHNIVAVNLSLGDSVPHGAPVTSGVLGMDAEFAALKAAGVFIAAAAGNDYYTHDLQGDRGVWPEMAPDLPSCRPCRNRPLPACFFARVWCCCKGAGGPARALPAAAAGASGRLRPFRLCAERRTPRAAGRGYWSARRCLRCGK